MSYSLDNITFPTWEEMSEYVLHRFEKEDYDDILEELTSIKESVDKGIPVSFCNMEICRSK